ncbi:excitatory amino acid transporter 3-like [Actinia tenebrosa]|uniref:Amino acid transporter n=1 Tax=Actinia tenebrosa TaxID=6105 RepID=A0A6P8HEB8_ACTTE|nr:excitatory amino acid transporter 3-like [Actinia tenebrosa]
MEGRRKCISCCSSFWRRLKKDLLLPLIILGSILGFVIGVFVSGPINSIENPEERKTVLMLIGFPGELFMNMLKMIVLPLIIASLISALASLDAKATGKIGRRVLVFYLSTTVFAAIVGLILVLSIGPGKMKKDSKDGDNAVKYRTLDSFLDLFRSIFPSNLVAACFSKSVTQYSSTNGKYNSYNATNNVTPSSRTTVKVFNNGTHNITMVTREVYPPSQTIPDGLKTVSGSNVLGIALFCVVFGIVLSRLREKARPLKDFFVALNEATMKIVFLIMWFAPVGICCLVCSKVAQINDISATLEMIGLFMVSVISSLLIHGILVLPLMYFLLTRKNPYKFMLGMADALVTAFGISSSAATLPTTIRCAMENNQIDERIAKFVLPLGATVNMDGGAIFEANVGIFVAQLNGVPITPAFIFINIAMATALSVGSAGIPSAGFIFPVILLQSLGLPVEDLALILPVEWLLDRFRTTVNVWGDAVGAGVVNHMSRDDLLAFDAEKVENGEAGGTELDKLDQNNRLKEFSCENTLLQYDSILLPTPQ